jgi:hypothetical protein
MESEDSQQPPEAREVAVDDAVQVRHPAAVPVLEVLAGQQAHPNRHVDGPQNLPALKKIFHRVHDAWVQRIQGDDPQR